MNAAATAWRATAQVIVYSGRRVTAVMPARPWLLGHSCPAWLSAIPGRIAVAH